MVDFEHPIGNHLTETDLPDQNAESVGELLMDSDPADPDGG